MDIRDEMYEGSITIKDLPEDLKLLVIIEQMEQGNKPNMEAKLVDLQTEGNFLWFESIKGWEFWRDIDEKYSKFYNE